MKVSFYLLCIVIATLFIGCENSTTQNIPDENPNNHYPLAKGNLWGYYYKTMYNTGVHIYNEVEEDTLFNDETWYMIRNSYSENIDDIYFLKNREDGVWKKDGYFENEYLYLRYPCNVGDEYQTMNEYVKVLSVNDTITLFTTGENYVAIVYFFTKDISYGPNWCEYFVPGIGIIRIDTFSSSISTQDLDSLIIN